MHETLIAAYERGAPTPARWIAGLTPADLNAYPVPGTWSIRELVVHILDSDLAATHRMRRIAAEDAPPLIIAYDESAFVKRLRYDATDLQLAVEIFALHRRYTAQFLRAMPTEAFERFGIHNQRGKVTLGEMVQMYVDHLAHHGTFLLEKRKALGKPLAM